ncbi:hypothetical protein KUCAC02_014041, partial [Chaenocephalus aceratus]
CASLTLLLTPLLIPTPYTSPSPYPSLSSLSSSVLLLVPLSLPSPLHADFDSRGREGVSTDRQRQTSSTSVKHRSHVLNNHSITQKTLREPERSERRGANPAVGEHSHPPLALKDSSGTPE